MTTLTIILIVLKLLGLISISWIWCFAGMIFDVVIFVLFVVFGAWATRL